MYQIRFLDSAIRDLQNLDKQIGKRIARKLDWLASNFELITPEALTGDLAGFFKYRVGDFRVLYEILEDERLLIVHHVGHRREIYRS